MLTKIIRIFVVSTIFLTVFESILGLLFVLNMITILDLKDYAIKTALAISVFAFISLLISAVVVYGRTE